MLTETLEYLGIAFVSSAALIVMSKIILQFILRRPADYYEKAELLQEERMLNAAGFSITEELQTNPEGELTEEHIHVTPVLPASNIVKRDQEESAEAAEAAEQIAPTEPEAVYAAEETAAESVASVEDLYVDEADTEAEAIETTTEPYSEAVEEDI